MLSIARRNWPVLVLAILAIVLRTAFYFYVDRSWEDALITVLHAENFWEGLGLTHFHNGQPPTHGFTSPLSVLIPLFGEMFSPKFGLKFIKIVSIVSSGVTVVYCYAICRHAKLALPKALALLASGYVAIEYQQILWGMAGLETQVVVLIVLMSVYYLLDLDDKHGWRLGVMLGLCMLARPDLFIWCVIAGVCVLIWRPKSLVQVTGWALLVYVPWLIFSTYYYGSFIPNTIPAKEAAFGGFPFPHSLKDLWPSGRIDHIFAPLGPVFSGYGTGAQYYFGTQLFTYITLFLALVGAAALVLKKCVSVGVPLFFFSYTAYYLYFVPIIFGWYLPPINAITVILAAVGAGALTKFLPRNGSSIALAGLAIFYLSCLAWPLPLFFKTEKDIQAYIEDGTRKEMALYLGSVMKLTDTVSLEPLGYVSYYSRRDVYDTPGLANRRVVQFYKSLPRAERNLYSIVREFYPTFVALRPGDISMEYGYFVKQRWFRTFYESDRKFKVDSARLESMWRHEACYDKEFVVFRRRLVAGAPTRDQWGQLGGWEVIDPPSDDVPNVPKAPQYMLSSARGGRLKSESFTLSSRSKVAMYVKCDGCEKGVAEVKVSVFTAGKVLEKSLKATDEWSLVAIDTPEAGGENAIQLDSSVSGDARILVTQPFILAVDERVPGFGDPDLSSHFRVAFDQFKFEGGWGGDGVYDKGLPLPNDAMEHWIGSHVTSDADVGKATSPAIRVDRPGMHLLSYTTLGPNVGNMSLGLDTDGDGKIDVPISLDKHAWKIDIKLDDFVGRDVRLIGIDAGRGWGEWFGFAEPIVYRSR